MNARTACVERFLGVKAYWHDYSIAQEVLVFLTHITGDRTASALAAFSRGRREKITHRAIHLLARNQPRFFLNGGVIIVGMRSKLLNHTPFSSSAEHELSCIKVEEASFLQLVFLCVCNSFEKRDAE